MERRTITTGRVNRAEQDIRPGGSPCEDASAETINVRKSLNREMLDIKLGRL